MEPEGAHRLAQAGEFGVGEQAVVPRAQRVVDDVEVGEQFVGLQVGGGTGHLDAGVGATSEEGDVGLLQPSADPAEGAPVGLVVAFVLGVEVGEFEQVVVGGGEPARQRKAHLEAVEFAQVVRDRGLRRAA